MQSSENTAWVMQALTEFTPRCINNFTALYYSINLTTNLADINHNYMIAYLAYYSQDMDILIILLKPSLFPYLQAITSPLDDHLQI